MTGCALRPLISQEQIDARVRELASRISRDYAHSMPVCVGVLKGAFIFLADLVRNLSIESTLDFIQVSSYGSSTVSSGSCVILKDITCDIAGRDVILIEDIVDSGLTLRYLRRNLEARNPASLTVCTLIARASADIESLDVGYVGFTIADEDWLVGYGLDVGQRYRNLGYLAKYVKPDS